jgi:hypothetical protein
VPVPPMAASLRVCERRGVHERAALIHAAMRAIAVVGCRPVGPRVQEPARRAPSDRRMSPNTVRPFGLRTPRPLSCRSGGANSLGSWYVDHWP